MERKTYKAYVINLDRSKKRWKSVSRNLSKRSIHAERFSAIDGQLLDGETIEDFNKNKRWSIDLSAGEIACYHSHIAVCRHFLSYDTDAEFLWIIEDDQQLSKRFDIKIMDAILENIPQNCDILRLIFSARSGKKEGRFHFNGVDYHFINPFKVPLSATSYLVSRKGAQKIVDNMQYLRPLDVDYSYWWENQLQIYCISPALPISFSANNKRSNIGTRKKRPFFQSRYYRVCLFLARMRESINKFGFFTMLHYQYRHYHPKKEPRQAQAFSIKSNHKRKKKKQKR